MKSRRRATSRKRRRAITGGTSPSCARNSKARWRCWVRRRRRSRVFTTRARENIICCSSNRAWKIVRSRRWKSSTCAKSFGARTSAGPLSSKLGEAIAARLAEGTQSLILINRRGIFLVCDLPVVRRGNSVRELQHFADVSQAARSPGMPLLRILAARAEDLSEVRLRTRLFFRRGSGAARRKTAREISRREGRAPGPRCGAHQAGLPAGARRFCVRETRHSGGHADGCQGT